MVQRKPQVVLEARLPLPILPSMPVAKVVGMLTFCAQPQVVMLVYQYHQGPQLQEAQAEVFLILMLLPFYLLEG